MTASGAGLDPRQMMFAAPLVAATAVFVLWAARDGGFAVTEWMPGTLFLLGLLIALLLGARVRPAGRSGLACLFLAAFTGWSFLSILWADVRGDAWDGANRTLLYLVVFLLFSAGARRLQLLGLLLGGYSLAIATLGTIDLLRAAASDSPRGFFVTGRLASPISYPNATCALVLAAVWPAVVFAARRELPPLLRAAFLAAAGVLLELGLMAQSRASVAAFAAVVIVLLVLTTGRLRLVLVLALLTPPVALSARVLLDVSTAVVDDRGREAAVALARRDILLTALVLALGGLALGLVDRRLDVPARVSRTIGRALVAAAAIAVVGGLVAFPLVLGSPASRASRLWHDFKVKREQPQQTLHLASGIGSTRYDVWRIALQEFERHPVTGVGADNYLVDYLRERETAETSRYPHSIELRALSQLGIIGALLLAGFLVAALAAAAGALRRPALEGAVAAAAVTSFVYWLVHGSVDWFWEYPALATPALAWLALAGAGGRGRAPLAARRRSLAVAALLVLSAAAAAASLAFPWVAAKQIDTAWRIWPTDPGRAFARLDESRRLNPLGDQADIAAGLMAIQVGAVARERRAFTAALARNRYNWYAELMLGTRDAIEGTRTHRDELRRRGLARLERASRLNPRDPVVWRARRNARAGIPLAETELNRLYSIRNRVLSGRAQK